MDGAIREIKKNLNRLNKKELAIAILIISAFASSIISMMFGAVWFIVSIVS